MNFLLIRLFPKWKLFAAAAFITPKPSSGGTPLLLISCRTGDALEIHYRHALESLGKEPGLVGIIFRKAQNKISNPFDLYFQNI